MKKIMILLLAAALLLTACGGEPASSSRPAVDPADQEAIRAIYAAALEKTMAAEFVEYTDITQFIQKGDRHILTTNVKITCPDSKKSSSDTVVWYQQLISEKKEITGYWIKGYGYLDYISAKESGRIKFEITASGFLTAYELPAAWSLTNLSFSADGMSTEGECTITGNCLPYNANILSMLGAELIPDTFTVVLNNDGYITSYIREMSEISGNFDELYTISDTRTYHNLTVPFTIELPEDLDSYKLYAPE